MTRAGNPGAAMTRSILGIDPGAVSGCGALEATIQLLEIPMNIIEPSVWKRHYQLRGGDKEGSRQRALLTFPSAHALLARRRDHGRGEASLIALYEANLITSID